MKVSVEVPLPLVYAGHCAVAGIQRQRGVPVTATDSLKVTVIGIAVPSPYVPDAVLDDTPVTAASTLKLPELAMTPGRPPSAAVRAYPGPPC